MPGQAESTNPSAGTATDRPSGYRLHAEFIDGLLQSQDARKASLEQRGLSVITTSGTLVTLQFAVLGLATRSGQTFTIPPGTRPWLLWSVVLFVLAAVAGIAVNLPLLYRGLKVPDFTERIKRSWSEDEWTASARLTQTRLDMLGNAQRINGAKAWLLVAAMCLEAGALAPLAVVVFQLAG